MYNVFTMGYLINCREGVCVGYFNFNFLVCCLMLTDGGLPKPIGLGVQ